MSFSFEPLEIPGVVLVRTTCHGDARGFFEETYRRSAFEEAGITAVFVQDNVARSARGVLRGLHFQAPPAAQGKLVQVLRGSVFDVAVDLRPGEPTFRRWLGHELNAEEGELLWIPPGFAHGYAVLSEEADLAYKVTAEYDPALDRGIRYDDPALSIDWPDENPVLSPRDRALPLLSEIDNPFDR
jgi:dTDP-4-dehydrorhamnose 3,5-epimerase